MTTFSHSWLITGFVTRLKRRVPLVEQEQLTLPEHMSSSLVYSGVRVTRSLVLCVYFVDRCLSCCPFSFGHCVVCPSLIYGFWLPLWYLLTLLNHSCSINYRAIYRCIFNRSMHDLLFISYEICLQTHKILIDGFRHVHFSVNDFIHRECLVIFYAWKH